MGRKCYAKRENGFLGKMAADYSSRAAKTNFEASKGRTQYHKEKTLQPGFHQRSHGGLSYVDKSKLLRTGPLSHPIKAFLWFQCRTYPTTRLAEYQRLAKQLMNISISFTTLRRIFKSWSWSWKKPSYVQLQKFTVSNIDYYGDYLWWLSAVDPMKCKFMDEAHFVSKDLANILALSETGHRIQLVRTGDLKQAITLTVLTDLSSIDPLYCAIQSNNNDQFTFLEFILNCVQSKRLNSGDFLICDNASIHLATETYGAVLDLLHAAGVKWIRLPKYSPELNPCELVFSKVKTGLRYHRGAANFEWELLYQLASVSRDNVIAFYSKCWSILRTINQI